MILGRIVITDDQHQVKPFDKIESPPILAVKKYYSTLLLDPYSEMILNSASLSIRKKCEKLTVQTTPVHC